jgi:hypothetical protein
MDEEVQSSMACPLPTTGQSTAGSTNGKRIDGGDRGIERFTVDIRGKEEEVQIADTIVSEYIAHVKLFTEHTFQGVELMRGATGTKEGIEGWAREIPNELTRNEGPLDLVVNCGETPWRVISSGLVA